MRLGLTCWCLVACGPTVPVDDGGGTDTDSEGSGTTGGTTSSGPSTSTSTTTTSPGTTGPSTSAETTSPGTESAEESTGSVTTCIGDCKVDVLFVVDNSTRMGQPQLELAQAMPQFESILAGKGLDVQVMFTTTDFGNPLCTPFQPPGYEPARGAPIANACLDRIDWFTGLGTFPEVVPEVCESVCPMPIEPTGDPFVAFGGPDISNVDYDGDGVFDETVAHALSCLAPMGVNGCGYEEPLENMLQALNPESMWNQGPRPFMREDAKLAIVILTNETDCSVMDFDIMMDEAYQEVDPDTLEPAPTSAICWNAGMSCDGPDGSGAYSNCAPTNLDALQPVDRYVNYLVDELSVNQDKDVVMLGLVGVPSVTEHADEVPHTPTAGGVADLEYREWIDGAYPAGDLLPEHIADGVDAADLEFTFGIGPGCTNGDTEVQAIVPGRLREVCEALDVSNDLAGTRCCLESICDDDYTGAIACLGGMIENVL